MPVAPSTPEALRSILFSSGAVQIGKFRCPREHPLFRDSGAIRNFVAVFPRTAGHVQFEGQRPFFVSPLISPFYNRGQRYIRCGANIGGDRSDWIALTDGAALTEIVREFDPAVVEHVDAPFRFSFAPCSSSLYGRQRVLLDALTRGDPIEPVAVEEEALNIVRALVRASYGPAGPNARDGRSDHHLYTRARVVLHESYREALSLAQLADRSGLSVPHLTRLFRRHAGASVHQILVELRLRDSLEALRDPRIDVSGLAADLGFSSHSHFSAAFRRAFGSTPSQVRGRISERIPRPESRIGFR